MGRIALKPLRHEEPFLAEAGVVLLATFIVMEAVSSFSWPLNVASSVSSLVIQIMGVAVISSSLLGIYGLVCNSKIGVCFALLAAVFEVISGIFSFLNVFSLLSSKPSFLLHPLIAAGLGFLNFLFLSKITFFNSKIHYVALKRESAPLSNDYAVEIIDVTKLYDLGSNSVAAVNGLSMKVRHGEILAIMGPSGSGKSTLLNLIGTLDRPTSGKILIDGVDISTLNDSGLAKFRNEKIGFVFQSYNLINRSKVLRNMELPAMVKGVPKEERLEKVHSLLSTVGLDDKTERKPKMMSGGEQQRVAIARALVNDPKILLADEPTGNLDSKTGHEIMEYLQKTSRERGTTVIVVTHNKEMAEMADRIIHFRDGRIVNEEVLRG